MAGGRLVRTVMALALVGLAFGCDDGGGDDGGGGGGGGQDAAVDMIEVPAEFADLENPLEGDAAAIEAGEQQYTGLCASCHGDAGEGDGPAAPTDPPPGDVSADGIADQTDGYLFWRISKGGAFPPFNSTMGGYESLLSEEQRWQVISYLRTL